MVEYFENRDLACVDDHSFRRDKRTGYYLSSAVIEGYKRRVRLHVYIWEKLNGKIPKGYHVHHIDGNTQNNEPENLVLLSVSEHRKVHAETMPESRKEKIRENLLEKAVPASKEWHKSKEGHEWHVKHGIETMEAREQRTYICSYCGKEFSTTHIYGEKENTFCSNNCKSAFRRKSGVDDIEKTCECCGGIYKGNKYQKSRYCPDCRRKMRGRGRK
jgi:hypothetical protein